MGRSAAVYIRSHLCNMMRASQQPVQESHVLSRRTVKIPFKSLVTATPLSSSKSFPALFKSNPAKRYEAVLSKPILEACLTNLSNKSTQCCTDLGMTQFPTM